MERKIFIKKEPLFHVVKRTDMPLWKSMTFRVVAILIGLLIGALLMFAFAKASPVTFVVEMFNGAFGTSRRRWLLFRDMALLLIVSLGLVPAFKMKFWNLGGNGQILMGALACVACMYFMGKQGVADWIIIIVMTICSILAGMIWALLPAIFKAFFNTNESLFTLMMNYVAAGLVSVFISKVITSGTGIMPMVSTGNLPVIYNNYLLVLIVAVVIFAFMFYYLKFGKHGYELTVVGESRNTAKYIGLNVNKVILRTLALSGAICGIVGLLLAGAINHSVTTDSANDMGFTAIMATWLAKFNPFMMVLTCFFITFLNKGTAQVLTTAGITNSSVSKVVIGLVYFAVIAVEFFVTYQIVPTHKKLKTNKDILLDGVTVSNSHKEAK
jgi:general nucleoside transport system permease protein